MKAIIIVFHKEYDNGWFVLIYKRVKIVDFVCIMWKSLVGLSCPLVLFRKTFYYAIL